jgi:hypothetical protein
MSWTTLKGMVSGLQSFPLDGFAQDLDPNKKSVLKVEIHSHRIGSVKVSALGL